MIQRRAVAFFIVCCIFSWFDFAGWSTLYKQLFDEQELQGLQEVVFEQKNTQPFNQLLFSWNAYRPHGYFVFYGQVRDKKTKKWMPWHKMVEWGVERQASFYQCFPGQSCYHHVRLHAPDKVKADGFRIKVTVHDGLSLIALKALFVNVVNLDQVKPEDPKKYNTLPSVYIRNVPKFSQMVIDHERAHVLCSTTTLSMLTSHFKGIQVNPKEFALNAHDKGLDAFGSWPFNVAHAFEVSDGKFYFYVARLTSFYELHGYLKKGIPVAVSIRGALKGAVKDHPHGHFLLVIGWDRRNKKVICHDPAWDKDDKVLKKYDLDSFLKTWENPISPRLAYIAQKV